MANLFERLAQEQPAPSPPPLPSPAKKTQKPPPAQLLLDWLLCWNKSTVTVRDICIYGPYSIRGRKTAIDAAETLVKNGWLTLNKPYRPNTHTWQIVKKLIVQPTVITETIE
jgi:hypothetical protein